MIPTGSICDVADTTRTVAVLDGAPADHDGYPMPGPRGLVGQTVTAVEVGLGNGHTTCISVFARLRIRGDKVTVDLGTVAESADEGVCGYALEKHFEPQVLRRMIEAAIADPDDRRHGDDRAALREESEWPCGDAPPARDGRSTSLARREGNGHHGQR